MVDLPEHVHVPAGPADEPEKEYTDRNAKLLADRGATKVGLIGVNNQASALFLERIRKSIEQGDFGLEVVYENVGPAYPDRLHIGGRGDPGLGSRRHVHGHGLLRTPRCGTRCRRRASTMEVTVFPGGYDPRVVSLPGMEGALFGVEFFPFELDPAGVQGVRQVGARQRSCGPGALHGLALGRDLHRGPKQAGLGCPTREAFIANLRLVDDYDGGGAFDPVDLSAGFGDEFPCVYYVEVKDGGSNRSTTARRSAVTRSPSSRDRTGRRRSVP